MFFCLRGRRTHDARCRPASPGGLLLDLGRHGVTTGLGHARRDGGSHCGSAHCSNAQRGMCARLAMHLRWARSAGSRTEAGSDGVMAKAAGTPGWSELEAGAPQIARLGMERLASTRVATLAALRPDGSPRISPVEPCLAGGCLRVGAMSWSRKAADLSRDPRYALHSAIANPDSGTGELKLRGRAAIASPPTPPGGSSVVVGTASAIGGGVRPGHRAGALRRMGYPARNDRPPVVSRTRRQPQRPHLPVTAASHILSSTR